MTTASQAEQVAAQEITAYLVAHWNDYFVGSELMPTLPGLSLVQVLNIGAVLAPLFVQRNRP